MKRTKKFEAATAQLSKLGTSLAGYENDEVYTLLEEQGYFWSSKNQAWEKKEIKPSVFDNPADGYVRIRVMVHPERASEVVSLIRSHLPDVLEESDPYPNREDVGTRIYLFIKLK